MTCQIVDFSVLADQTVKESKKKKDKYQNLARELKKMVKNEGSGNNNESHWKKPEEPGKETRETV